MQVECKNCGLIFDKSNSEISKSPNHFHNKSCAAIYNNKHKPKRIKKEYFCIKCGIKVPNRWRLCKECNPQIVDWSNITLGDVIYHTGQVESNRYTRVRDHAKRYYKASGGLQKCFICGYDKYFEVCHIKPIRSFNLSTPITAINSLDNLIALCPNCHWEFDNSLLIVPTRGLEPLTLPL